MRIIYNAAASFDCIMGSHIIAVIIDDNSNMRIDTLSQMLSFGNVHANSKVLVVDDTQGLVISAVAERMGGKRFAYSFFFSLFY